MSSEQKRNSEDNGGYLFFVSTLICSAIQEMDTYITVPQIQLPVTITVFIFLNLQRTYRK